MMTRLSPLTRKLLIALALVLLALGGFTLWLRHVDATVQDISAYEGTHPKLDDPHPQHVPGVGLVRTVGWAAGQAPTAAPGLKVSRFAEGLTHPRTLYTLPNGDVLVAETDGPPGANPGGITGFFQRLFQGIVGAGAPSPDTIVLLRDSTGGGHAAQRFVLRHEGLHSPSGMAYANGKLYIADHDAVLAFDYKLGDTTLTGTPTKIMDLPGGGNHWMRNLLLSPDGKQLYIAVGSSSNIGENGLKAEQGRASILQFDLAHSKFPRLYAAGMRNPNGMAWNPSSGELWTVVNERDMLGPNLVPDYLTNVPIGAHYGWPWVYWKDVIDERVNTAMPDYLTDYTRKPEYAMGPHVAPLGLVFAGGGARMGADFANGAFIARHGSWNRRSPTGYDVVFVKFDANGNPLDLPRTVLTGFLTGNGKTHGRPVWLAWAHDGALLVSDDTGGVIWRVIAPGAAPSPAPKPVETGHMPPQRELKGDPNDQESGSFGAEGQVKQ